MQRYILTAFGKDRPGIVADVTRVLYGNGCNLEENSMTLLADEFTLILLFSAQGENISEDLSREFRHLEREKGIWAYIRPINAAQGRSAPGSSPCTIFVEGEDQSGIVYKISQFLADNSVNIVDLKSTVNISPGSGTAIYQMAIHAELPGGIEMPQLESGLSDVADELHVDIQLVPE
ncbi:MAG: hypothetical protein C0616_11910 [Desulfuromonas sp.]|nr:MAG: hypothetical protein C0616_11910 [Desulfuromonas sp.]